MVSKAHIEVGQSEKFCSSRLPRIGCSRNLPHSQMDDNEFEPGQQIFTITETKLSPFLNSPFLSNQLEAIVHLVWLIRNYSYLKSQPPMAANFLALWEVMDRGGFEMAMDLHLGNRFSPLLARSFHLFSILIFFPTNQRQQYIQYGS